jgi:hypothetical protein
VYARAVCVRVLAVTRVLCVAPWGADAVAAGDQRGHDAPPHVTRTAFVQRFDWCSVATHRAFHAAQGMARLWRLAHVPGVDGGAAAELRVSIVRTLRDTFGAHLGTRGACACGCA